MSGLVCAHAVAGADKQASTHSFFKCFIMETFRQTGARNLNCRIPSGDEPSATFLLEGLDFFIDSGSTTVQWGSSVTGPRSLKCEKTQAMATALIVAPVID